MTGSTLSSTTAAARKLLAASLLLALISSSAAAGGYKGALSSDTLVYDVIWVAGDTEHSDTWFAQWVGNVYSKAQETENRRSRMSLSERIQLCESASWIAPKRHIWKEGDEPYLTRSQALKPQRLEHRMKHVRCRKETTKIEGISRRALKSANEWLGSRSLTSVNVNQENNQIDSVEMWIRRNVPNVVSIKLNRKESGMSAPEVSS